MSINPQSTPNSTSNLSNPRPGNQTTQNKHKCDRVKKYPYFFQQKVRAEKFRKRQVPRRLTDWRGTNDGGDDGNDGERDVEVFNCPASAISPQGVCDTIGVELVGPMRHWMIEILVVMWRSRCKISSIPTRPNNCDQWVSTPTRNRILRTAW
jgi:hypothetical protein